MQSFTSAKVLWMEGTMDGWMDGWMVVMVAQHVTELHATELYVHLKMAKMELFLCYVYFTKIKKKYKQYNHHHQYTYQETT